MGFFDEKSLKIGFFHVLERIFSVFGVEKLKNKAF